MLLKEPCLVFSPRSDEEGDTDTVRMMMVTVVPPVYVPSQV